MFNHPVLDITIGIIFVFLVYSLLASAINEIIAALVAQRGRMLLRGIQKMLNGESIYWWHNLVKPFQKTGRHRRFEGSLADQFRQHTLFRRLARNKRPAYLSDGQFSNILLDLLHRYGQDRTAAVNNAQVFEPRNFNSVKAGIIAMLNELDRKIADPAHAKDAANLQKRKTELYELASVLLDQANGDLQRLKRLIENWYNEMMDRVTGWYKRQTHQVLFFIGLGLTIMFNVDAIAIIKTLTRNKDAREALATMADSYIKNHPRPDTMRVRVQVDSVLKDTTIADSTRYKLADSVIRKVYNDARADVDSVNTILGLGWSDPATKDVTGLKIFGLLITALAISLGAPFWFDLLNKLVNLRMNGRSPNDKKSNAATGAGQPAATTNQPFPGSVG